MTNEFFSDEKTGVSQNKKSFVKYISIAASIAAVIIIVLIVSYLLKPFEYAYINLDINPSVEFTIDKNSNVLKVSALNSDAKILLQNLKLKNLNIKAALTKTLRKSSELGYIKDKEQIILLSSTLNENNKKYKNSKDNEEKKLQDILTSLGNTVNAYEGIKFESFMLSYSDRKAAFKNGLSMGRYAIYLKAERNNINMTIDEAKKSDLSEILEKVKFATKPDSGNLKDNNDNPSDNSSETTTSSTPTGLILHFKKPTNWSPSINIYYWDVVPASVPNSAPWPGNLMTAEGNNWYSCTIEYAKNVHIVFNDGNGNQTANLLRIKSGESWFFTDRKWYDSNPDSTNSTAGGLTVHFKKPTDWNSNVRIYYHNQSPKNLPDSIAWPGTLMIAEENGWYRFTISGAESASIIFNDSNGKQTKDLSRSSDGWYIDNKWHFNQVF